MWKQKRKLWKDFYDRKGSCGKSERKLWKVQICVSCGKNRRKLWKIRKKVVENKKESCGKSKRKLWKKQKGSCGKILETKSKSWKVINRGKPPRILKINKKANRGTALKGGQLCANSLVYMNIGSTIALLKNPIVNDDVHIYVF